MVILLYLIDSIFKLLFSIYYFIHSFFMYDYH